MLGYTGRQVPQHGGREYTPARRAFLPEHRRQDALQLTLSAAPHSWHLLASNRAFNPVIAEAQQANEKNPQSFVPCGLFFDGGRYWDRTSDPCRVKGKIDSAIALVCGIFATIWDNFGTVRFYLLS